MRLRDFKRFVKIYEKELNQQILYAIVVNHKGDTITSHEWALGAPHFGEVYGLECNYVSKRVSDCRDVMIELPYQEIQMIVVRGVVYA